MSELPGPEAPPAVSVVIPVYNPGRDIDRCIDSLLRQSLTSDRFEAIFIDDGSTDETPARLDALAGQHPHIRVVHIANSGWPGKPRNIGIEQAVGAYVQFVDQDDHLGPEALERLYEMGVRNHSDIVIGKVTSDFRGVPHGLFRRDRDACTIHDAPLIDSLTPHKMFRREFLLDHGIRFPEGPYILEDQLFMVRSYFRTTAVSILASYPCYFYNVRTEGTNTASRRMDPPTYYRNLRDVVEVVMANTEPGEFRDRLLRRSYRVEMLGRLGEPWYPRQEPAFRDVLFHEIRGLAADHMNDAVHEGLTPLMRLRSTFLRADRPDDLVVLANRAERMQAVTVLERIAWLRGRLTVGFTAACRDDLDASWLRLLRRGEQYFLDPAMTHGILDTPFEVTHDLKAFRIELSVRHLVGRVEWRVSEKHHVEFIDEGDGPDGTTWVRPVVHVTAAIDPLHVAVDRPLSDGTWEVRVRVAILGIDRRVSLGSFAGSVPDVILPAWLGHPAQVVRPILDPADGLRLVIERGSLSELVTPGSLQVTPSGGRTLEVALPVASDPAEDRPVRAAFLVGGETRGIPARLVSRRDRLTVQLRFRNMLGPVRGRGTVVTFLDGPDGPATTIGTTRTGWDGRTFLDGGAHVGVVSSVRHYLVAATRALARPLPTRAKRVGRRLLGRRPAP